MNKPANPNINRAAVPGSGTTAETNPLGSIAACEPAMSLKLIRPNWAAVSPVPSVPKRKVSLPTVQFRIFRLEVPQSNAELLAKLTALAPAPKSSVTLPAKLKVPQF